MQPLVLTVNALYDYYRLKVCNPEAKSAVLEVGETIHPRIYSVH